MVQLVFRIIINFFKLLQAEYNPNWLSKKESEVACKNKSYINTNLTYITPSFFWIKKPFPTNQRLIKKIISPSITTNGLNICGRHLWFLSAASCLTRIWTLTLLIGSAPEFNQQFCLLRKKNWAALFIGLYFVVWFSLFGIVKDLLIRRYIIISWKTHIMFSTLGIGYS